MQVQKAVVYFLHALAKCLGSPRRGSGDGTDDALTRASPLGSRLAGCGFGGVRLRVGGMGWGGGWGCVGVGGLKALG